MAHPRLGPRGRRYEYLTQNENKGKLAEPAKVVGKFGVAQKDALATFDRHRVAVLIRSRYSRAALLTVTGLSLASYVRIRKPYNCA